MELTFFNHLAKTIQGNARLKTYKWPISIYRFYDKNWHTNTSVLPAGNSKLAPLSKVRDQKKLVKVDLSAYFYIKSVDAAIEVTIPKGIRSQTIQRFENELHEVVQNAEFRFNAHHDQLTRLLNRTGFEDEIKKALTKGGQQVNSGGTNTLSSQSFVALLTFDIDHFKQINDSFHHQYGDAVLKAFSWRIAEHVKVIENRENVECILARVGGEEFDLLVTKLKEKNTIQEIAESLRTCVAGEPIPSKDQWKSISKDLKLGITKLPTDSERSVRTSIGYSMEPYDSNADPIEIYSKLKGQAEAALYRAKSNGRNCVINYEEIRKIHGKIHESYVDTEYVSIDIGSDVGVKAGDVFAVRLPNFSGGIPLFQEDGRSKKKLGVFPKLSSGRIVTINVQESISFCQIIEKSISSPFPHGSRIEYIPMGIGRPLPKSCPHAPSGAILSPDEFISALSKAVSANQWHSFFVFNITERERGAVSSDGGNRQAGSRALLANLIRASFPSGTIIGYVRSNLLAAFYREGAVSSISNSEIINKVLSFSNEEFSVTCGYVDKESQERDWSDLAEEDLLYVGRVANFVVSAKQLYKKEDEEVSRLELFTAGTANEAIFYLRKMRLYEDAIVDYHRFRQIGINTYLLHNQLALIIIDPRDVERMPMAELALRQAIEINDEDGIVLWNMGVVKTYLGKYAEAYESFKNGGLIDRDGFNWLYHLSFFKCAYELEIVAPPDENREEILSKLVMKLSSANPTNKAEIQWLAESKQYARKQKAT